MSPHLLLVASRHNSPGEQVVVHGEPDPEPRPVLDGVAGEDAVRLEEPLGGVAEIGGAKQVRFRQVS